MKFRDAVNHCKVRGYIARPNGYHAHIPDDFKFAKNHHTPIEYRVPWQDQVEYDWEHFDPEGEETSIVLKGGKAMNKIELIQNIGNEVCEGCGPDADCGIDPFECSHIDDAVNMFDKYISEREEQCPSATT